MQVSRHTFLRIGAGAAAYSALRPAAPFALLREDAADLLLVNGPILTMAEGAPVASALAIGRGKVLAAGAAEDLRQRFTGAVQVVDLGGRSVTPGLIDAHSHLIAFGQMQRMFVVVRPPKVSSFDTLKATLRQAAGSKKKGEWIVARGFQEFKEGRWPRREDLDRMLPDHPLLMIQWSGQYAIANTLALKMANLLRTGLQDPYGGVYMRDRRTGLPDGILVNYPAIYSVYRPTQTEDDMLQNARWAIDQFAKEGVTCVHDNFAEPTAAATYVRLEQRGQLPIRVRVYPYVWNLDHCREVVQKIRRVRGRFARLQGIKLAVDGYALMYDVPDEHREMAIPMHPQDVFEEIIATIHRAGFQADVHAVGDKGVDWTLRAYEKACGGARECRERRHRIEHFPFLKLDSIRKAAEMGVPVCEQPYTIDFRVDDFMKRNNRLTKKQIDSMVPLRTFLREGVPLAFGADVPAFPSHRPLDSIRSAMTRRTAAGRQLDTQEALTFLEALKAHTAGGAHAAFDEKELGTLEPGKEADFVVWNRDLTTVRTARDLDGVAVETTYVAGQAVYRAGATTSE